jgi:hypothetical protein
MTKLFLIAVLEGWQFLIAVLEGWQLLLLSMCPSLDDQIVPDSRLRGLAVVVTCTVHVSLP